MAIAMLLADRGTAYDPIVVDAFARVYLELAPTVVDLGKHVETLKEIAAVAHAEREAPPPAEKLAPASSGDTDAVPDSLMVPLLESMHAFSAQAVLTDATEALARVLQGSTPATLCAFFVTQPGGLELTLGHAVGTGAECLRGMHFPMGEKLTGWVAATQRTVCNSDPSLDFVDLSPAPPGLQSCLSVPLLAADGLVGVLSLYAPERSAFNDQHRRTVERSARPLAHMIRGVLEFERVQEVTAQSALAALPVLSAVVGPEICTRPTAVISFKVVAASGAVVPDLVVARAAAALRRDLRVADFLYRDGPAGLLAVLPHVDRRGATALALRAHARVKSSLASQTGDVGACSVVTGVATSPSDGIDLDLVMQAARDRAAQPLRDEDAEGVRMRQPHLFDLNAGAWVDVA
jgi:putative methionine-R-sulfoxide reductase with GAF domain